MAAGVNSGRITTYRVLGPVINGKLLKQAGIGLGSGWLPILFLSIVEFLQE